MHWFLKLMEELGIECRVGHPQKIRKAETRKQKHDRRDARLILKLLVENRFPTIWMPSNEQRDVRTLLRHRHQWVRMRSRVQNSLQSMALTNGLRRGHSLWSQAGQHELQALPLAPHASQRRAALLALYPRFQESIDDLDQQVSKMANQHPQAQRLMTHPGVGPVTALATEVFLGDPKRFVDGKTVASYIGMIPSEHSSGAPATTWSDEQARQCSCALPLVRSGNACSRTRSGVKTLLSTQTDTKRNGKSEDRGSAQTRDPTLDHDARRNRLSRVLSPWTAATDER
jgi:transposase